MQQAHHTLTELGIEVVVVTFESERAGRAYVEETGVVWPVMIDDDRRLYHAYGMSRAKLRHLWGPTTWWVYLKELVRGNLPKWPVADTSQQGGDVLIDPSGTVRFVRVGAGPGNRPRVGERSCARVGLARATKSQRLLTPRCRDERWAGYSPAPTGVSPGAAAGGRRRTLSPSQRAIVAASSPMTQGMMPTSRAEPTAAHVIGY